MAVSAGEKELAGEIESRSRLESRAVGVLSERVMKSLHWRIECVTSSYHFGKVGLQLSAAGLPLLFKVRPAPERLLRANFSCRERRIEVCAPKRLFFWDTLSQKYRKAADECVSRACCVNGLDAERRNEFCGALACEQTTTVTQCNDHAPHPFLEEEACAFHRLVNGAHRHPGYCLRFAFVGNEILGGA